MIAFLSYGLFWWSLVFTCVMPALNMAAAPTPNAMGCYMFIWGVFSFAMLIGTLVKRAPLALSFVVLTVVVLFMLLAASFFEESKFLTKVAGIEGVICGLSAIYLAVAEILNELAGGRKVMPIGDRA